ncbi:MAG: urease accessory protein UreD [Beijerinckiaceae bacterium]|nr:urease accessory protein UreD [Beijerinckiaceae bacterium]
MYAAALRSDADEPDFDPLASVRSRGVLALSAHLQDGVTRRLRVREEGALRMRFPHESPKRLDAVVVNVAGGMAGGDVYDCAFAAQAGAHLVVTSAAAEKVYRALGAPTRCDVRLRAESGSSLLYAPQEAILFDRVRIHRRYDIEVDSAARLIAVDAVILGRAAMGERVNTLVWRDTWRLRRDGKLIWADATRVEGDAEKLLTASATGGGARAFGTLVYATPDAAHHIEPLREVFRSVKECEAAVTCFEELLIARFVAHEGHRLRAALIDAMTSLPGGALPRSWST